MKQEIAKLQENNDALKNQLMGLNVDKESLQTGLNRIEQENNSLKGQIDDLNSAVETLQASEEKINTLMADLADKVEATSADNELKEQLSKLETLQTQTRNDINFIADRLNVLENAGKQQATPPAEKRESEQSSAGIFSYFTNEGDGKLFSEKVSDAVNQGMTYAQIDKHLTDSLPKELDTIVKDHPTLTKTYIRSVRDSKAS